MDEQKETRLGVFTLLARPIVENAKRMETFLPMMDSPEGVIQAVQSVIGAIENQKKRRVPPDVAPLLAVNVYLLMVDMAHKATDEEPDEKIVKSVIVQLLATFRKDYSAQQPKATPAAPAAPQGIIQKAMA